MPDDAERDKDASRLDTVPPPQSGDAYSAETVVRNVAPELLAVSKGAPRPRPKKEAAPVRPARPRETGIARLSADPADDDAETQLQSRTPHMLVRSGIPAPASPADETSGADEISVSTEPEPRSEPRPAREAPIVITAPKKATRRKAKGWFDLEILVVFVVAMVAVLFVGMIVIDILHR